MFTLGSECQIPSSIVPFLLVSLIWSLIWKGIGLWKAGRNKQVVWFIVMLISNTAGLLPIIYLWKFQKKQPETIILPKEKKVKKKSKKKKK